MTIITGTSISGFRQHGIHLTKVKQEGNARTHDWNDEVELICSYNLASGEDIPNALREMSAIALGSRCHRFLYAGSINPDRADGRELTPAEAESAAWKLLESLGFSDKHQWFLQRHKKHGRNHYHVCANRVDPEHLKAVELSWNYPKQEQVARELETLFNLRPTRGAFTGRKKGNDGKFKDRRPVSLMNRDEDQQSKRTKIDVSAVIWDLCHIWGQLSAGRTSDSESKRIGKRFAKLLDSAGYTLAKGDARDLVVLDRMGGVHNPARRLGLTACDFRQAIGDLDSCLPTVEVARAQIKKMPKAESELDESGWPTVLLQSDGMAVPERNPGHLGGPR